MLAALLAEKLGPMMPVRVNGAPRAAIVPPITRPRSAPRPSPRPRRWRQWNGPPILGEINDPAQLRAADFVLDYPASKYSHAMATLVRQLEAAAGIRRGHRGGDLGRQWRKPQRHRRQPGARGVQNGQEGHSGGLRARAAGVTGDQGAGQDAAFTTC